MRATLSVIAKTDVGKVRDHNEDTFIVGLAPKKDEWTLTNEVTQITEDGVVVAVADGMGGANAGEIASEIAVQSIKSYITSNLNSSDSKSFTTKSIVESALIFAHNKIKDACRSNNDLIGMGTTATIAYLIDNKIYIAWIGDSRAYRYSTDGFISDLDYKVGNLELLTEDHSKVWSSVQEGKLTPEEARIHKESNIITQSLGDIYTTPHPESVELPFYRNDIFLLTSDGLNGMLSDAQIESIIKDNYNNLENIATALIDAANDAGGHDNITIVLCKIVEGEFYTAPILSTTQKTIKTEVIHEKNSKSFLFYILISAIAIVSIIIILNNLITIAPSQKIEGGTIIPKDTTLNEEVVPGSKLTSQKGHEVIDTLDTIATQNIAKYPQKDGDGE